MSFLMNSHENFDPTASEAVDPAGEASVFSGKVAHFVCQHRAKLCGIERAQHRESDDEIIGLPAKHSKLRDLNDARIEVAGEKYVMDLWTVQGCGHFMHEIEKRGGLFALQLGAVRHGQRYPK